MYAVRPVLPGHEEMPEVSFEKPGYNDLPAVIVPGPEGEVISRWRMSDDEMGLLVNGGDVYLSVKTFNNGFPPVKLRVATSDQIWYEPRSIVVESPQPVPVVSETPPPAPETAIAPISSQSVAHESEPTGQITPPDFSHPDGRQLFFSRYAEDGSLRLYPKDSYLNDEPAGYSEDLVNVKILVVREHERYMVILPVRRAFLDDPSAEKMLAERAWAWRS